VTLKEALAQIRKILASKYVEEANLEAELLLRHAANLSIDKLYLQYNRELTDKEFHLLFDLIKRRLHGEPVAYILGYKEFFGLTLDVNHSVLIPRPETEMLVEKAIEFVRQKNVHLIADIGTGCGAIAISLAKHLPECKIYAIDISKDALEVAKANRKKHGVDDRVRILPGNLLEPIPESVDLIIANLPYVKNEDWERLPGMIKASEPKTALAGGANGLDVITELLAAAKDKLRPNGTIMLEIGYDQGGALLDLAYTYFPEATTEIFTDLAELDRVVSITTKESDVPTVSA
jgi:release factor glutamine methyltransferase